jgi:hypothetical protein
MVDLDSFFIKDSNAASNKPYFRGFIFRVLVREGETSTGLFARLTVSIQFRIPVLEVVTFLFLPWVFILRPFLFTDR